MIRYNGVDFTFADLAISEAGGDVLIETPDGDSLTLSGLGADAISANDFLFFDPSGALLPVSGDDGANLRIDTPEGDSVTLFGHAGLTLLEDDFLFA